MAQTTPLATAPLSSKQLIQVIEERVYPIYKQDYTPSLVANNPSSAKRNLSTVEGSLSSWVGSMARLEYREAITHWDKESIQLIESMAAAQGKGEASRLEQWRVTFTGRKLVLKNKLSYGQYVLINYEILTTEGQSEFSETVAFRRIGNDWFLTLDLADTAVPTGWKNTNIRQRKVEDGGLGHRVVRMPAGVALINSPNSREKPSK